jgi:hypothetical protein
MELKPGMRLRSQVCDTEVIVIRGPAGGDCDLTCGGETMVPHDAELAAHKPLTGGLDGGTLLGKRYAEAGDGALEILVTRAGAGTLAAGPTSLVQKAARVLPSSD